MNDIAITGLGILSSAGITPDECWNNVMAGESMAAFDPRLREVDVKISCPVTKWVPSDYLKKSIIWRTDPFIQYALYAAGQAVKDSGLECSESGPRTGLVVGNSLGGVTSTELLNLRAQKEGVMSVGGAYLLSTMGSMACGNIAMELGIKGPTYQINTACASGSDAVGLAGKMIEQGKCDIVIVGASEAPLTPLVVSAFSRIGALTHNENLQIASRPFDRERDGFVMSEGAAFIVLERMQHAKERKTKIYAKLSGYGSANDAYHVTSPSPDGDGLRSSISAALEDAGLKPADIDCINAHGTSTPLNDLTEGKVITDLFGESTYVTSTKGVTGHSLAATGAIEAVLSVLKIHHDSIPPVGGLNHPDEKIILNLVSEPIKNAGLRHVMSNSLGFGGQNASIILSRYE